jgi:biopolymer transport protein ExbD
VGIQASKSQVNSTPNVVPMIDVMLVLLIIFMVVTPALMAGFNAKPPEGVTSRTIRKTSRLTRCSE